MTSSKSLIAVPEKTVELESGEVVRVPAFRISKRCVTVREFQEFASATGYVTLAERSAGAKLFTCNELIEHLSESERGDEPAFCMSWRDASEYCKWAGVRLPTETEWLAASIIDDHVYDIPNGEPCPWVDGSGDLIWSKMPDTALEFVQTELTATQVGEKPVAGRVDRLLDRLPQRRFTQTSEKQVVARSGPWYFRAPLYRNRDWRDDVAEFRHLYSPDEWDLMLCFRYVVPSGP